MAVSLITITLNSGSTIDKCLNSVEHQTLPPNEYKIIDGLSRDKTLEIVNSYKSKNIVNEVLSEKDRGISDAFNKGISVSNSEFVCMLNSDDWIDPNYIEEANKVLKEDDPDIILPTLVFVKDGESRTLNPELPKGFPINHWLFFRYNHPGSIIRKKLLVEVGGYDEKYKYAMDIDLMLKLIQLKPHIVHLANARVFQGGYGVSQSHFVSALLEVAFIEVKFGRTRVGAGFGFCFRVLKVLVKKTLIRLKLYRS